MKYDIITFGSATQDVFLKSRSFKVKQEKKIFTGKGICLSLGSKIPVEKVEFLSGGGGTNTAFTFKNQDFETTYCGMVGDDPAGWQIKRDLEKKGIATELVFFTKTKRTNYSVILGTENERTILTYRGASEELKKKNIPWRKLKTKWFYLAPFSGKLAGFWESVLIFAKRKGIKVAMNPGSTQLMFSREKLKKLLNLADVLILNQEEASLATGVSYNKEEEIFETLDSWVRGICIMTKGPLGGVLSDGKYLYNFGILKEKKIVDRTGTGDAFGSGFLTGLLKSQKSKVPEGKPVVSYGAGKSQKSIEYAIQFGSANATGCLQKFGAKNGLLKKGESIYKFGKIKIKINKLQNN